MRPDTRKLLEENISNIFFDSSAGVMKIKTKIDKWDLVKVKSFCIVKETINKTKTTHRMEKNISKLSNRQGINLQTIQASHAAKYKQQQQKQTTQSKTGQKI